MIYKHNQKNNNRPQHPRSAFTLAELMVVVGIIALLMAIALPSFNAARNKARATATQATIQVLAAGAESFRAETSIAEDFPPSMKVQAYSPHDNNEKVFIGANLLTWALAGADLLGTPGFRDFENDTPDLSGSNYLPAWYNNTGNQPISGNSNQLYIMDQINNRPAFGRSGPYVDVSKMSFPERIISGGEIAFKIPAARQSPHNMLNSRCFLDSFGQPILYYKANKNAPLMVDSGGLFGGQNNRQPNQYDAIGDPLEYYPTGVYNLLDNSLVTGVYGYNQTDPPMDFGAGVVMQDGQRQYYHKMGLLLSGELDELYEDLTVPPQPPGCFAYQVWNQNVTATRRPHNDDSYFLISAGPDGIFGSGDDIANLPISKN